VPVIFADGYEVPRTPSPMGGAGLLDHFFNSEPMLGEPAVPIGEGSQNVLGEKAAQRSLHVSNRRNGQQGRRQEVGLAGPALPPGKQA
jgi:hypothetical protein